MTKRPFILRALPPRLRGSVWSRYYRPAETRYRDLFTHAPLHFAPNVRMELVPGDLISDSIALTGIYELQLTRQICALAHDGGLMVDVGANLGYFSLLWLSSRADNRVVVFEPSPRNIDLLQKNYSQNGFANRVDIRTEAAGKENTEMYFDVGPPEQTGWGRLVCDSTDRSQRVQVVRLDHVLHDRISVLKIDAEGADTWIIQGAQGLLESHQIGQIFWEQNKPCMHSLNICEDEAADCLKACGYVPKMDRKQRGENSAWSACSQYRGSRHQIIL